MRFSKIRITDKAVELFWSEGEVETHLRSTDRPAPAFAAAMQTFSPYVTQLLDLPLTWSDVEVRQIALNEEEETGYRGLVVTATRKIAKAHNRALLINTPYIRERGENDNGDGFLDEETVALIEAAESEATKYVHGERGEQTSLDFPPIAESDLTPEQKGPPRRPKKGDFVRDGHPVMNAEGVELTDERIRNYLLEAERDVPLEVIASWPATYRETAAKWARLEALRQQQGAKHTMAEPEHVQGAASRSLWEQKPVRVDADGAQASAAAVEAGE